MQLRVAAERGGGGKGDGEERAGEGGGEGGGEGRGEGGEGRGGGEARVNGVGLLASRGGMRA